MTSSWVKVTIAMVTHLPLFLYDLIQHAFKNMKAIIIADMHPCKGSCHASSGRMDI